MEAIDAETLRHISATVAKAVGLSVAIVGGLVVWLGRLWLRRILQSENAEHSRRLEELKHDLALGKSTYDQYLELILSYYSTFYRHYRLCQRAANADGHRQPDGTITSTKDDFFDGLDAYLAEVKEREGALRLLLPSGILAIHERSLGAFNEFKHAVDGFKKTDETRERKRKAFQKVDNIKTELEGAIREFLRVENLLK